MSFDVKKLVRDKIAELGTKSASEYFGVSYGTVSNWQTGKRDPSAEAIQRVLDGSDLALPASEAESLTMWEGRKLMILLPWYKSGHPRTHYSLFANYARYGADKIAIDYEDQTLIDEARSILIDRAMKTDAETFLMVDDDMILPCGNEWFFNTRCDARVPSKLASRIAISRIMSHGRDKGIVGGLYFGRHRAGRAQCSGGFSSNLKNREYHSYKNDGLVPEQWVATGVLKIERWVIEAMKKHIDAGKWPECKPNNGCPWTGYFAKIGTGVGEDASFGCRAAEIGIKSYVDAGLVCLHIGQTAYGPSNTIAT
jgi:transcriptional regulator with XRE-family HTH domain